MNAKLFPILAALVLFAPLLGAQTVPAGGTAETSTETAKEASPFRFVFSHVKGDKYRVLSTVDEEVLINGRFAYKTQILNRIAVETLDAGSDGSGILKGKFETSEHPESSSAYVITDDYDSQFTRDRLGRYVIDPQYYMPTVRSVPTFPDRELKPLETWNAPGEERHDFRRVFGIPDPYAIPIDVRYQYVGDVDQNGQNHKLVTASYTIFLRPAAPKAFTEVYPVQIAGFSDQKIYWDPKLGNPDSYEEKFDFIFDWSDASTVEYRGIAQSKVIEASFMNRDSLKDEISKAVAGIPDVAVSSSDQGVTISLENIQFQADSARLNPSEDTKIAKIAELLKKYPERDILVAGHTAAAGYAAGRQKLSQDRAASVAERLIQLGARTPEHIQAVGYGDTKPVADNASEEGRARNRRVEITILEN